MKDPSTAAAWLQANLPSLSIPMGRPRSGTPGDQPDRLGDLAGAVQLVAGVLAEVHSLPVGDFTASLPGVRVGWEGLAERIESRRPIDTSTLPAPYNRYDHQTLRRLWVEGRPPTEDLVVCHGQPDLGLMSFAEGRLIELGVGSNVGPLVADRHLDLAVIHQSIMRTFGAEAVFVFYEAYGTAPDMVRLDHYVLATHLW